MRANVKIYFIRHGQTDWNAEWRYQGQEDIPINEQGRAQAMRNGEALKKLLPAIADAAFVSSPLSRARETMHIVRTTLGLDEDTYATDDRLLEVNYGDWQGTLAAELPKVDPEGMKSRSRDPFNWRPKGGESYAELMVRAVDWLNNVERDSVVVSHGGVSRVLRGQILGLDEQSIPVLEVPHDRILILREGAIEWL